MLGRRKIKIEPLKDDRVRQVTFLKRKSGLIKKAIELSVLCDCEIALLVFNSRDKLYEYSSIPMNRMLTRYSERRSDPHENWTNLDYQKFEEKQAAREAAKMVRDRAEEERKVKGFDQGDDLSETDEAALGSRRFPRGRRERKVRKPQIASSSSYRTRSATSRVVSTPRNVLPPANSPIIDSVFHAEGNSPSGSLSVAIPQAPASPTSALSPGSRHQLRLDTPFSPSLPSPFNRIGLDGPLAMASPGVAQPLSPSSIPLAMTAWPVSRFASRAASESTSPVLQKPQQ